MSQPGQDGIELEIQRLLVKGDLAGAATAALHGYRAEIFGFLLAFHRDEDDAVEVFSLFSERLWRDLPSFRQECSFRTWAYVLARHASFNYRRDARRRSRRQLALPEGSELSALVAGVRSETASYLRTERRDRFSALRESLPAADQELLVLRVDRKLAWNDLARVLHEGDEALSPADLVREAARLRKRFQLLKERLRTLGERVGVVGDGSKASRG